MFILKYSVLISPFAEIENIFSIKGHWTGFNFNVIKHTLFSYAQHFNIFFLTTNEDSNSMLLYAHKDRMKFTKQ